MHGALYHFVGDVLPQSSSTAVYSQTYIHDPSTSEPYVGIDARFGKIYQARLKGKIVDGVLTTEGKDWTYPATAAFEDVTVQFIRAARFQLKLTTDTGEGFIAGYTDVAAFYRQLNESWSTHHQSYGQESAPSLYRALHRLADGFPDATGKNTAISSALQVKFTQVFLQHPARETAAADETAKPARH